MKLADLGPRSVLYADSRLRAAIRGSGAALQMPATTYRLFEATWSISGSLRGAFITHDLNAVLKACRVWKSTHKKELSGIEFGPAGAERDEKSATFWLTGSVRFEYRNRQEYLGAIEKARRDIASLGQTIQHQLQITKLEMRVAGEKLSGAPARACL